jgi:hypothetical protein
MSRETAWVDFLPKYAYDLASLFRFCLNRLKVSTRIMSEIAISGLRRRTDHISEKSIWKKNAMRKSESPSRNPNDVFKRSLVEWNRRCRVRYENKVHHLNRSCASWDCLFQWRSGKLLGFEKPEMSSQRITKSSIMKIFAISEDSVCLMLIAETWHWFEEAS